MDKTVEMLTELELYRILHLRDRFKIDGKEYWYYREVERAVSRHLRGIYQKCLSLGKKLKSW